MINYNNSLEKNRDSRLKIYILRYLILNVGEPRFAYYMSTNSCLGFKYVWERIKTILSNPNLLSLPNYWTLYVHVILNLKTLKNQHLFQDGPQNAIKHDCVGTSRNKLFEIVYTNVCFEHLSVVTVNNLQILFLQKRSLEYSYFRTFTYFMIIAAFTFRLFYVNIHFHYFVIAMNFIKLQLQLQLSWLANSMQYKFIIY